MSAFDDFSDIIKKTDTMKTLLQNLEEEPANFLGTICREYEKTNKAVPDHHLNLAGYFAEAVLKALVAADFVIKEQEDRFCLYCYTPTESGLKFYQEMLSEKKI